MTVGLANDLISRHFGEVLHAGAEGLVRVGDGPRAVGLREQSTAAWLARIQLKGNMHEEAEEERCCHGPTELHHATWEPT